MQRVVTSRPPAGLSTLEEAQRQMSSGFGYMAGCRDFIQSRPFSRASLRFCESFEHRNTCMNILEWKTVAEDNDRKSPKTLSRHKKKSIDNDKVIRGRPLDQRSGRFSQRNERPKAADRGIRPTRSLPPAKEGHVSEVKQRSVTSAPSKEQKQKDGPMPKINTFVSRDSSPTKQVSQVSSLPKPRPPHHSTAHHSTVHNSTQPSPEKQKSTESPVKSPTKVTVSPDTKGKDSPSKSPTKAMIKAPGQHKQEDSMKRQNARQLPPDDHGPTWVKGSKGSSPEKDSTSNYYASAKEREEAEQRRKERESEFKKEIEKQQDSSPRGGQSVKSVKTDKSWSTIKTKDSEKSKKSSSVSPTKSKSSYDMKQSQSNEMKENKRREVTIVDPRSARRYDTDGEEVEPFLQEYEYAHSRSLREKEFNDMSEDEKMLYFRDHLKMKPDQIRELTFHPKVTEKKTIHRAYTGIETGSWSARSRSGRRPKSRRVYVYKKVQSVAPHQRKSYMHSRLQGVVYRHINNVYGASPREHREKSFYQKLTKLQMDEMQRRYQMLAEKERRKFEGKLRQREQLQRVRRKFEDDAWKRFMTQYVTSKVVEAEYRSREEYGLPNDLGNLRQHTYHGTSRRQQYTMTPRARQKQNVQKYSNMFRYNVGPEVKPGGKPMKFENFDSVYIDTEDENGKPTKKRQDVDALMREAKRLLDQSDNEDTDYEDASPRTVPRQPTRIERPKRHRSRGSGDDKSVMTSSTSKTNTTAKSKSSSNKQSPHTMKDMLDRRQQTNNRYKASGFTAMKDDLLKDSDMLNKNTNLKQVTDKPSPDPVPVQQTSKPAENKAGNVASTNRNMRTPPPTPLPGKPASAVKQTVKTVTRVTTTKKETVKEENPSDSGTQSKRKQSNSYLDNTQTQMQIETARDKLKQENQVKQQSRAPSRAISKMSVNKVDNKNSSVSPTKASISQDIKTVTRAQSRLSVSPPKELPPVRPPSSAGSHEPKVAETTTKTSPIQRRVSKASVTPIDEVHRVNTVQETNGVSPSGKPSDLPDNTAEKMVNETARYAQNTNASATNKPNNSPQSKILVSKQSANNSNISKGKTHEDDNKETRAIKNNVRESVSPKSEHVNGTMNGHATPEKTQTTTTVQTTKVTTDVNVSEQIIESKPKPKQDSNRNAVSSNDRPKPKIAKDINITEQIIETKPKSDNDKSAVSTYDRPKPKVTKSVNIQETTTETTTKSEKSKPTNKGKGPSTKAGKNVVWVENDDALNAQKSTVHDRNNNASSKGKQTKANANSKRVSQSRSPVKPAKMNGHVSDKDSKMKINDYEQNGHDGHRATRRAGSRDSSPRQTRAPRGRKRSVSPQRKKSPAKSRFPDIEKKDGKWEITARSTNVKEEETERIITPDPTHNTTNNQWKSLVEKYIRQPSPKMFKTEDRSLLESPFTDDDDDIDIFKRATQRYKLNVDSEEDDDSDV